MEKRSYDDATFSVHDNMTKIVKKKVMLVDSRGDRDNSRRSFYAQHHKSMLRNENTSILCIKAYA